jgi:hypothetical protein
MSAAPSPLVLVSVDDLRTMLREELAAFERTDGPRLIDRAEVARRIGISLRSLDTLRAKGLPEIRVLPEAPRFDWFDVIAWLKERSK